MSERERALKERLRAAGLDLIDAGIGRDDDVAWAKIRIGGTTRLLLASHTDDDESSAPNIIDQAQQLGA